MPVAPYTYTYQQCLSTYLIWIASCIDEEQKDYYQECTSFEIWYNKHRGNRIQIIFFNNHEDYLYILKHSTFAWRVDVHYQFCKRFHCPPMCTREEIITVLVNSIMDIYKHY